MEEEIEQPKVAQEDPRDEKIRDLKSQIKSLKSELAQAAQASSSYAYDEKKRTEELEALRALRVVRFYFWSKRAISAARSVDEWKKLGLRLLVGSVAFVEETGRRLSGAFKILVFGAA